jgi:hypothetical protein
MKGDKGLLANINRAAGQRDPFFSPLAASLSIKLPDSMTAESRVERRHYDSSQQNSFDSLRNSANTPADCAPLCVSFFSD